MADSRPWTLEVDETEADVVPRIWQEVASRSTDEIAERPWVKGVIRRPPRHRPYPPARLLHCGRCGRRLHGQAAQARGKEWRYYRCRGCDVPAAVADEVEMELVALIAEAVLPSNIIELAREELRTRLALPRDDGKLRRRLDQRRERLSQLFA